MRRAILCAAASLAAAIPAAGAPRPCAEAFSVEAYLAGRARGAPLDDEFRDWLVAYAAYKAFASGDAKACGLVAGLPAFSVGPAEPVSAVEMCELSWSWLPFIRDAAAGAPGREASCRTWLELTEPHLAARSREICALAARHAHEPSALCAKARRAAKGTLTDSLPSLAPGCDDVFHAMRGDAERCLEPDRHDSEGDFCRLFLVSHRSKERTAGWCSEAICRGAAAYARARKTGRAEDCAGHELCRALIGDWPRLSEEYRGRIRARACRARPVP